MMSCLGSNGFHNSSASALPLTIPNHTSPEPNVDSFIHNLLQAVTNDDTPVCSSCEEGATASYKCRDCSEMLCDPCVRAHQRVRITKEHTIIRFNNEVNAVLGNNGSLCCPSLVKNSTNSPGVDTTVHFCDTHHDPYRLYCDSCFVPICTECSKSDHRGHSITYMTDKTDSARSTTLKLCTETRNAITTIKEAIDNIQKVAENVEVHSRKAATDVKNFAHRFLVTVEERKNELLTRIECAKQVKHKNLTNQMDYLRSALGKLIRTVDSLTESLATNNTVEMVILSEKAALELKQLQAIRTDLVPCETDHILFIPADNVYHNMNSFGQINTGSFHGQLRTPIKSPKELLMTPYSKPIPIEMKAEGSSVQRAAISGRPIYGLTNPVIVKDFGSVTPLIIGSEGEKDGQLCRPWGVCCDKHGNIIVADRSNNRIQIFRKDGSFMHKFGEHGVAPGQFDRPAGVAIDPMGRIVVADKDNHRIQLFTLEGTFVLTFGEKGSRIGQFNYPWDVAVNVQGNIVVSDTRNHRIQLFTNEGIFINKYGFEGTATMWKHFDSPRGVCFNPWGYIIVTDFNNHRLVIIDPSFSHAQFLGQEGSGLKQFLRPQGIVCDDEGRIIIADSRNHRIQIFESIGTFLWKCGQSGKNIGELDRPSGICLNPEGRIVVVDFGNNRVQIF